MAHQIYPPTRANRLIIVIGILRVEKMIKPKSVVFVCNKNSVFSPIAAALVRQKLEGKIEAVNCGLEKEELNPFAFGVCEEVGLSLILHTIKTIEDIDLKSFDLVVALSPEAAGFVRSVISGQGKPAPDIEFWHIADPSLEEGTRQQILLNFRQCRDDLEKRIKARFSYALPGNSARSSPEVKNG